MHQALSKHRSINKFCKYVFINLISLQLLNEYGKLLKTIKQHLTYMSLVKYLYFVESISLRFSMRIDGQFWLFFYFFFKSLDSILIFLGITEGQFENNIDFVNIIMKILYIHIHIYVLTYSPKTKVHVFQNRKLEQYL